MDLNYDQFNGDALIFKYNLDEYGNPISIKVDKEEKQVSVHGTIQLEYVPDEYNKVIILNEDNTQMTEVFNRDEIKPNTYYVDYNNGVVYLDKSQFGKTKIYNYYNKGIQLIGCSRIYDEHDISGKHVVLTLQEIIDAGREALRFLLDIGDAKKVIELLESLIAEGKLTITNLENKKNECIQAVDSAITEAEKRKDTAIQEIQDNIQQAKDEVINVAGNKEVIIKSSDWTLNVDVYEKEITHDLNSENLHVTAKNSDTKEAVTIGYKIVDKTRILLKSDEAINMSVILSASYYHATQTISDDIAEEVVKARKGEADLKTKIDSIDEQLDTKAGLVYVDNRDAEILRQVEQGVTDDQLKNAIQSKIDDGTIPSLAVGNDAIQNTNIKDNTIYEQKLAFVPNINICSNITDVQLGISGTSVTIYLYAKENIKLWYYLNTGGNNYSINLNSLNKSYTLENYKSLVWDLTTNTLEVISTGLSNKNKHILLATNENGIISVGYIANLYTYIRNYSDMRSIQQTSVSMFLTNPTSLYLFEENKQDGYVYIKFSESLTLNTSRIYNVADVSKTYDEIVAQLNSQSLYDNTQKTSWDNIKNCLRLASAEILVYDYINSLFTVVKHSSLDKYKHIVIAKNIDGALAEGQLKSLYLNKLINYNLLDTSLVQTDIWDSYRDKLNRIISNQNTNTVTFSWITDVHTEESDKKCVTLGYNYLKRVADNISLDFMINGGDNILGHKGKQAELSNHRKLAEKLAPHKPFYLIGNHDTNVGETPLSMSTVIHPRELYNIYGRKFKDEVVWGNKEQMYYYKDIEDKNIRMIFLNTSDYIYEDDGTGYSKLGGSMGVRQEQVRWFGEVALNTDKEVIVFTHIPLLTSNEGIVGTGETLPRNMIAFKGLLEAFKNGTRYTYSYTDPAPLLQPYFNCSVDVDFTSKGQGRVICVISGHVHLDQMIEQNGIKHITTLDEYNDKWHETLSPDREPFTSTGFAFDIVNLNINKRTINFYRFGAGEDREYSY